MAVCPKIDELQAILDELDRFVRMEHAELYRGFRPGLTQHEVDQLAGSLQPYYLPVELVSLYRWHDGWRLFMNDECRFLPTPSAAARSAPSYVSGAGAST